MLQYLSTGMKTIVVIDLSISIEKISRKTVKFEKNINMLCLGARTMILITMVGVDLLLHIPCQTNQSGGRFTKAFTLDVTQLFP